MLFVGKDQQSRWGGDLAHRRDASEQNLASSVGRHTDGRLLSAV
jgi:hypothetical protein